MLTCSVAAWLSSILSAFLEFDCVCCPFFGEYDGDSGRCTLSGPGDGVPWVVLHILLGQVWGNFWIIWNFKGFNELPSIFNEQLILEKWILVQLVQDLSVKPNLTSVLDKNSSKVIQHSEKFLSHWKLKMNFARQQKEALFGPVNIGEYFIFQLLFFKLLSTSRWACESLWNPFSLRKPAAPLSASQVVWSLQ